MSFAMEISFEMPTFKFAVTITRMYTIKPVQNPRSPISSGCASLFLIVVNIVVALLTLHKISRTMCNARCCNMVCALYGR